MADPLVTTVLKIGDCGHDEFWLRDIIYDNPSVLGLGEDLQAVMKEKTQSSGGRLDLLLNDSDDSMYEVEVQLGETNESHIIRTIKYWDNEKRRWPNRAHTAVLVAEKITSRFFNVVQLLSRAVPIIGIQANIVQVGDVNAPPTKRTRGRLPSTNRGQAGPYRSTGTSRVRAAGILPRPMSATRRRTEAS